MRSIILIVSFILGAIIHLYSQNNTATSGGQASGIDGTIDYSIGQIDYITEIGIGGTSSQGIQQPYEFFDMGIEENKNISLTISAYPIPTLKNLNLKIENQPTLNLFYQLYDLNGNLIFSKKMADKDICIPMEKLPSATYFLKIMNNKLELKNFKIIKN